MSVSSPRRTNVYIDGFNLYYGSLRKSAYKWLDVVALARLLLPAETIQRVRYFTARVSGAADPGAPARQGTYLRALRTLPEVTIHMGTFLAKETTMPLALPPPTGALPHLLYRQTKGGKKFAWVTKTEEKGSDVNLATALLLDAFDNDCELSVVISNDSDLMEPIRLVRQRFHPVGVVNPHKLPSVELGKVSSWQVQLFASYLKKAQLPNPITDSQGSFGKPPGWP